MLTGKGNYIGPHLKKIGWYAIQVRPNQQQLPGRRKVAYYLNGSQSGRVYQSPFIWGGPSGNGTTGFDTRTLADDTYTLGHGLY